MGFRLLIIWAVFRSGAPRCPFTYLFVFLLQTLSNLIVKAKEVSSGGFKIKGRGEEGILVSHLFADDTHLFCKNNEDWLKYWEVEIHLLSTSFRFENKYAK